eukprot:2800368-Amphidinium_carterae.1
MTKHGNNEKWETSVCEEKSFTLGAFFPNYCVRRFFALLNLVKRQPLVITSEAHTIETRIGSLWAAPITAPSAKGHL